MLQVLSACCQYPVESDEKQEQPLDVQRPWEEQSASAQRHPSPYPDGEQMSQRPSVLDAHQPSTADWLHAHPAPVSQVPCPPHNSPASIQQLQPGPVHPSAH
ncbi:hypothetical protein DIPPA_13842 [Diplonema papillatum]|nr:hypothetical protein DIPPA_13842 [Diplonema papillatum]